MCLSTQEKLLIKLAVTLTQPSEYSSDQAFRYFGTENFQPVAICKHFKDSFRTGGDSAAWLILSAPIDSFLRIR